MKLDRFIRFIQDKYSFLKSIFINRKKVVGNVNDNNSLYHICVTASKDYTIRVLAMYDSLNTHSKNFKLWVCCMDKHTFKLFEKMNLEHMVLFYVEQVEDEQLRKIRQQRNMNEYCWTLKGPLIHHLLTKYNLETILYCDGDVFFFSDPKEIFDDWGQASVYLCPQRDAQWVEQKYGKYQAGLIGFRNDSTGLQSLKWWRKRCEEWCSAEPDDYRFGDQKYLDKLPKLFSNIQISNHLGIDAAPWNCIYNNGYQIENKNGAVYIEDDKLIAYHFACFTIFDEDEFDLWSLDTLKIKRSIKKNIYEPYIVKIRELIQELKKSGINAKRFYSTKNKTQAKTFYKYTKLRSIMDQSDEFYCFSTIVSKKYLIKGLALYQSLVRHGNGFHLWVCCMDNESLTSLKKLNLENVTLIPVEEIENNIFSVISTDRTLTECCWTMKAPLCNYILQHYREVEHIVYCDADMYFFSSPKPIFDEWSTYSIFLCTQRSTELVEHKHGIYQAGLIGFKQEPNSIKILNWWREKCLEWCYDSSFEVNRWGDQKYLNEIPNRFSNIKVIDHIGIDAAPWNLVMKEENDVHNHKDQIFINKTELVSFHFGSLLIINENKYELWKLEELPFTQPILNYIYTPYIYTLRQIYRELKKQSIIENPSEFLSDIPTNYTPKNVNKI